MKVRAIAKGVLSGCLALWLVGCASSSGISEAEFQQEQDREQQLAIARELQRTAESLYQKKQFAKAKMAFEKVIELHKTAYHAHYRLGNIAFREKKLVEAENHFERVIKLNPRLSKAYYNLAVIHLIQAEDHFKFYTATLESDAEIDHVVRLLQDINRFSKGKQTTVAKPASTDPLERLAEQLQGEE